MYGLSCACQLFSGVHHTTARSSRETPIGAGDAPRPGTIGNITGEVRREQEMWTGRSRGTTLLAGASLAAPVVAGISTGSLPTNDALTMGPTWGRASAIGIHRGGGGPGRTSAGSMVVRPKWTPHTLSAPAGHAIHIDGSDAVTVRLSLAP